MLLDTLPGIELYVSDIRPQILESLSARFAKSGSQQYKQVIADLEEPRHALSFHANKGGRVEARFEFFDLIVADVPCTGSGTWGRNPENLLWFEEKQVLSYAEKQQSIVANILPFLKKGGKLVYITCSVFAEENENAVAYFLENHPVKLLHQQTVKGYEHNADSMFVAVLSA